MKKMIILCVGLLAVAGGAILLTQNKPMTAEEIWLMRNVEALGQNEGGGTKITVCLGIWGECSINGAESKAPLAQIEM